MQKKKDKPKAEKKKKKIYRNLLLHLQSWKAKIMKRLGYESISVERGDSNFFCG